MNRRKVDVLLLMSLLLFTACQKDSPANEQSAIISLSLDHVSLRDKSEPKTENSIEKVRIYVFKNGQLDAMEIYPKSGISLDASAPFSVKTTIGKKNIYVVANELEEMKNDLDGVRYLKDLEKITTSKTAKPLSLPLIMMGSEEVDITTATINEVKVNLRRLSAKITLKIKKGDEAEANKIPIKLTGVRLCHATASASLIKNSSFEPKLFEMGVFSEEVELTDDGISIWSDDNNALYLYENIGSAADKTKATYIIIDVLYNGIPTRYKMYINDENATSKVDSYCIKRNYQYNLTATINNLGESDGLFVQCETLPWEKVEVMKDFGGETKVKTTLKSITGNVTSKSNPITFNVTLISGPENAIWQASLDNGLEFAFEDPENVHGELGEEKSITIVPLKPYKESPSRTTHFYITVTNPANGEKQKVALIEGSDDTEIVITQVED